jgi:hypothetical protein
MTLITSDNGQNLLIDCNIRAAADDETDDTADVAADLRKRLKKDSTGRLFVDVMLLSHPDADHCTGLKKHFHLGNSDDWVKADNKIIINEMWSSPIVFRRADKKHVLCEDAKAWASEARRRVQRFKDGGFSTIAGERILILGEDVDRKTDEILDIVIKLDSLITRADRNEAKAFEARLLGPLAADDDEEEEELTKNNSSVILRFSLAGDGKKDKGFLLTGGDADASVWEKLWQKHGSSHADWLSYDILQAPHHSSWRSLSHDRWSELGEKVKVCDDARSALAQTREGAVIVASCKPIKADDDNPPHERAKREYLDIVENEDDRFFCTGEHPNEKSPETLEFEVTSAGPEKGRKEIKAAAIAGLGIGGIAQQVRAHGKRRD